MYKKRVNMNYLLDKCNFNLKNFKNYLNFKNGKIDPSVEYDKFESVNENYFICSNCHFKNKRCNIVDILIDNFDKK